MSPSPPAPARSSPLRYAAPFGTLAALSAAVAYVGAVDPSEPGHYPACPLLGLTGVHCPGCGGLRAVHALAHGDLGAALTANALVVAGSVVLALAWAAWLVRTARRRPPRWSPRPVHLWAAAALTCLFTLVRNLPSVSGLTP